MDPIKEIPVRVKSGEVRLGGGGQRNSVDSYKLIILSGSHWDGKTGLNTSIKTVWTSQVSSTINPGVGREHAERKGGREVREKKLELRIIPPGKSFSMTVLIFRPFNHKLVLLTCREIAC